jgi:hypothetical protein
MRNDNGASVRRRVPFVNAPGITVGIEEELIRAVVEAFYARVRTDADLGPIFQKVLDWPAPRPHVRFLVFGPTDHRGLQGGRDRPASAAGWSHRPPFRQMDRTFRSHDGRALHAPTGCRVLAARGENRGSHQGRPKKTGIGLTRTLQNVVDAVANDEPSDIFGSNADSFMRWQTKSTADRRD